MKDKPQKVQIITIRDRKVVLDTDLARIYGVSTKALNQSRRRNKERFPSDFAFQLSSSEYGAMRSQIVTASSGQVKRVLIAADSRRNIRHRPWVFTEHGALQLANVIQSERAIAMSLYVIRAFIEVRERVVANAAILKRLAEVDRTLL